MIRFGFLHSPISQIAVEQIPSKAEAVTDEIGGWREAISAGSKSYGSRNRGRIR